MLARLALRNVRRSARDYAIYFVTIALGVATFYAFNALGSQAVLLDALSSENQRVLGLLDLMMRVFSIVVVCVLGFLVVYANRFLIRRRKHEFGMYLLLGMGPGRVSAVLLLETLTVGLMSLVVGLSVGIALSQGLSFATAALMGTTMSKYRFIVSGEAVLLTVACFLGIFAVSALIDIVYVGRCRLSSLLATHEGSEHVGTTRLGLRVAGFVCSVVVIALAYRELSINGLMHADGHFVAATVLMVAGTFLFFWSVAGFVVVVLQRNGRIYLKNLAMFTTRQISSKINTAFASLAVVCVMLFFALTVSSVGLGLVDAFVGGVQKATYFDATLLGRGYLLADDMCDEDGGLLYPLDRADYEKFGGDMAASIGAKSGSWDGLVRASAQLDFYYPGSCRYASIIEQIPDAQRLASASTLESIGKSAVSMVSVSQFNAVCALIGAPQVVLADDECAVNNQIDSCDALARAACEVGASLTVAGTELHFAGTPLSRSVRTSSMPDSTLLVVVPDRVVDALVAEGLMPDHSYLDIMYACDRGEGDVRLASALGEAFPPKTHYYWQESDPIDEAFQSSAWPVWTVYSGLGMADQASGLRMIITYLAVYIGFVLLMATAAILAIQQLSETADSLPRYRRLATLGCSRKAVMRSLRVQTVVYFLAPLLLAACHTACAVAVVGSTLFAEIGVDISGAVLVAAGTVCAVYAVYLLVTCAISSSIVKGELE